MKPTDLSQLVSYIGEACELTEGKQAVMAWILQDYFKDQVGRFQQDHSTGYPASYTADQILSFLIRGA